MCVGLTKEELITFYSSLDTEKHQMSSPTFNDLGILVKITHKKI